MSFYETRDAIIKQTFMLREMHKDLRAAVKKLDEKLKKAGVEDEEWDINRDWLFDNIAAFKNHSFTFDRVDYTVPLDALNRYKQVDVLGRLSMICYCAGHIYAAIDGLDCGMPEYENLDLDKRLKKSLSDAHQKYVEISEEVSSHLINLDNIFFKFYESLGDQP